MSRHTKFVRRSHVLASVVVAVTAAIAILPSIAEAQERGKRAGNTPERRGGYSYSAPDTINTYGDSRGRYGRTEAFRDPNIDRQTNFGPFDNGFFFDSGIGPRGGNSPYLN
ncbi:MAG: hypothetical protein K2Y05_09460 [Hyphomicrobiaceae bacterium]|nr:hypothetical protein [Hyphomicrobiaceae bacterium]